MSRGFWKIPVAMMCVIAITCTSGSAFADSLTGIAKSDPDTAATKKDEPEPIRLRFEPYGVLWTAAAFESSRTLSGDYTFYVLSPATEGDAAFHLDAKSSRLGIRMLGSEICFLGCGTVRGLVEIDFQGPFVTENKAGLLLRHAYWEIDGKSFRILGGQTWDVISPLNPGMLMYTVGWGAGNIGYRRAQLRGEKSFAVSKAVSMLVQASANADIVSDFSGDPSIAGDHASWPVLEGRVSLSHPRATVGVSGHFGEQVFDFPPAEPGFDCVCPTWSANFDGVFTLSKRVALRGEFFTGSNLGAYLGGILQGMDATRQNHIASTGGWMELATHLSGTVDAHAGFGIDDPSDTDLTSPSERTRNTMLFGNVTYSILKSYLFGIEVSYWETEFVGMETGKALHTAAVTKFTF